MTGCTHDARVVAAVRSGRPSPDVEAHLETCATCRELAAVVREMTVLGDQTHRLAERRRLPEAAQLWWKGQLARRWEAEARAVAPLDRMQRIEVAAGIVAALVLLVSFFNTLGSEASGAAREGLFPALAGLLSMSALVWGALVVVGAATASLVMIRRLLAQG